MTANHAHDWRPEGDGKRCAACGMHSNWRGAREPCLRAAHMRAKQKKAQRSRFKWADDDPRWKEER